MANETERRAIKEANRAVAEALRQDSSLRDLKIVRFGRHRDGYLHGEIQLGDQPPVYVFCKFGSWQIPNDPQRHYPKMTGPALRDVVTPYTYALSDESLRFKAAERKRQEERDAQDGHGGPKHAPVGGAAAQAA